MLNAALRKKRTVTDVYRKDNALYLAAEAGMLRLLPQTPDIIRVSYTENDIFSEKQGAEYADLSDGCTWDFSQNEDAVCLRTDALLVKITKATGSIRYESPDGTLILAEKARESHLVEKFDSFRTVVDAETEVEEIVTPDGVKKVLKDAKKVFDKPLYHTRLSLEFAENEHIYGLGQSEEGVLNLRHCTRYLHQDNLKISIPLMVSSRGYGILLSTQSVGIFRDGPFGSYLETDADEMLNYYFIGGGCLDKVISGFRMLTYQAAMLPKWAYGYFQSKERYETEQEILDTVQEFRDRHFGLDAIVLDWCSWKGELWGQKTLDEERFPNPDGMMEKLHEMNTHFMISIWPNMDAASDNNREFAEHRLLLPASDIYDAFSEEGRKLYWEQVQRGLFCHGFDAWWCDSSEPVTPQWNHITRPDPATMYEEFKKSASDIMPREKINSYGLYHALGIYEGQRSQTEEKRVVNLTRNGYAGSQKYGTILWSGDISASWDTLRRQVVEGLHFCASGMPYWTLDIGAFFVKRGTPWFWNGDYDLGTADPAYRELYVRWFQYGAFLPIFRSHGTDFAREPWRFGEPGDTCYDALMAANRLRYRLMPYIYSLAGAVTQKNSTIMRMLAFDFADDSTALDITDQFMFGPSLMVCPVLEPGTTERRVYLPAGTAWYHFETHEKFEGGQWITVPVSLQSIPVFVREGAILPTMIPGESTAEMEGRDILLEIYPGQDGSFVLYEDAGDGYAYEKGDYCLTKIRYTDADGTVSLESEGNLKYRNGEISWRILPSKENA